MTLTTHVTPAVVERSSLLDRIARRAQAAPDATAMCDIQGSRITRSVSRSAFLERVRAIMAGLHAQGFEPGDRVLFSVRPGINAVALVVAIHEIGGVIIPQDPGVADALFRVRMQLLRPRWIFAESVLLMNPNGVGARLLRWRGVSLAPIGTVQGARVVRVGPRLPGMPPSVSLGQLVRAGAGAKPAMESFAAGCTVSPNDDAFIVCTSGTTSAPKAVVHTRRSLAAILRTVESELKLTPDAVVYGKDLHLILPALCIGARVLIQSDLNFHGARVLKALERQRVTHAFMVTRDCRLLLDACRASGQQLSASLESLMIGAAPVRAAFLERLRDVLPPACHAWCVYGATEVLPVARVSLHEKVGWTGAGDLVGRPIPGVTVRIASDGQLMVRGDRLCRGYLGDAEMTEYATGDLATLSDGRIVLLGRRKDMLIRGDHNIYPELYEPIVERIAGVRRAALVGDFDPVAADERIVLVVEAESGVCTVVLRERVWREVRTGPHRLDRAALPDEVVVADFPESGRSRKIDKAALRTRLGLRDAGVA